MTSTQELEQQRSNKQAEYDKYEQQRIDANNKANQAASMRVAAEQRGSSHEAEMYRALEKQHRQAAKDAIDNRNNAKKDIQNIDKDIAVAKEEEAKAEQEKKEANEGLGDTINSVNPEYNNTAKAATNESAQGGNGDEEHYKDYVALPANNDDYYKGGDFYAQQDTSQNFKLPNWDYLGYAQELNLFRKGLTGLTSEPGWFYFKIIFHFDETHGLLGNIITSINFDEKTKGNTAIQFLESRKNLFKQDNLKARAVALRKFVKYLSYINSVCPWYFDKITGLDQVVPQLGEFSKEKKIDIGCMVDAVDLRLTSLLHLYQYACYDDIFMKEIIPENLRKFNMSIIVYHMPLKFYSTTINNGEIKPKSLQDGGEFSNRMSYKLYTFKGCEIDLNSLGSVVPGSLDNAQPFNLGQNTISIKYDRAFTHLMNEWEQFMVGSDGFYYNVNNDKSNLNEPNIGNNSKAFYNRISKLIEMNDSNSRLVLDSLLTRGALTVAQQGQMLGNIYEVNIQNLKTNTIAERNSRIYLENIFGNVDYFKGLALARNVPKGKSFRYKGYFINSEGLAKLPNSNEMARMFRTGQAYRLYYLSNATMSKYYISEFDLYRNNLFAKYRSAYAKYNIPPYQTSISDIVTQYKNAWSNIKGIFKHNVNSIKNIGKDIARSWGF